MNKFTKILLFIAVTAAACIASWLALRPGAPARTPGLGKSFEFDADGAKGAAVNLPRYTQQAIIPLKGRNINAVTVDQADRIILSAADGLTILSPDGTTLQTIPLPFPALCAATDTNGTLYVGTHARLAIVSPDGTLQASIDLPQTNALPSCIAIRKQHLFVADAENGTLVQLDRSGQLVREIKDFVLFASPGFDVAFDAQGFIWANNPGGRELRKYHTDGQRITTIGRPGRDITGFSGCCNPTDIAILPNGSIVTSEKNIMRVKVLDSQGRVIALVAGPDDFNPDLHRLDIATDSRGRVLVLDTTRNQLRIFERTQDKQNELEE